MSIPVLSAVLEGSNRIYQIVSVSDRFYHVLIFGNRSYARYIRLLLVVSHSTSL